MSALYAYDAAFAPNLAECKRKGAIAMTHYMTGWFADSSPQPGATRAAGMGIVFNWERAADALKGATQAQGLAIGHEALAALPPEVPRDGTVAIYYSVDVDLVHLSACDEAFRGINAAHAGSGVQVRVYSEGGLIERLCAMRLVQGKQWLSMSEGYGGFQHAMLSGLVAMVQMHDAAGNWIGTDVRATDRNTVLAPYDLGAWWNDGSPYARRPLPPPPPVDTDYDFDALMEELVALYPDRATFESAMVAVVRKATGGVDADFVRNAIRNALVALKTGQPDGWFDRTNAPGLVDGKGIA